MLQVGALPRHVVRGGGQGRRERRGRGKPCRLIASDPAWAQGYRRWLLGAHYPRSICTDAPTCATASDLQAGAAVRDV